MPQVPVRSMYGNKAHPGTLGWAASFHLCMVPDIGSVHVCVYICVRLESSHASHHGCFLLSCGSPFVFSSGCWPLSRRCCSSCCSTLSSTGNFWSCWSSFSLCFPSQGCCLAVFFKLGAAVVKLRCWFEWPDIWLSFLLLQGNRYFFLHSSQRALLKRHKNTLTLPVLCHKWKIPSKELSGYETWPIESLMLLLQFPHICTFRTLLSVNSCLHVEKSSQDEECAFFQCRPVFVFKFWY